MKFSSCEAFTDAIDLRYYTYSLSKKHYKRPRINVCGEMFVDFDKCNKNKNCKYVHTAIGIEEVDENWGNSTQEVCLSINIDPLYICNEKLFEFLKIRMISTYLPVIEFEIYL